MSEPPARAWGHGLATSAAGRHRPRHLVPVPGARRPRPGRRTRRPPRGLRSTSTRGCGVRRGRSPCGSTSTRRSPRRPTPTCASTCCPTCWCAPNTIYLDGTDRRAADRRSGPRAGPCRPRAGAAACRCERRGRRGASGLDRFPRLTDYVCRPACGSRTPPGCGSARTSRPGPSVMHEGFVNYNAGTLGASMVEGRISQGVVVGDGSDIGGGASIMGTLSGGGTERVSIGRRCLLGANAGPRHRDRRRLRGGGGPLRDGGHEGASAAGRAAARREGRRAVGPGRVLFRRNSLTGAVEAVPRTGPGIALNPPSTPDPPAANPGAFRHSGRLFPPASSRSRPDSARRGRPASRRSLDEGAAGA